MTLTYKYRIKDSSKCKVLNKMASSVNFVWNYCNEVAVKQLELNGKFLSEYDLHSLTNGCTKELGLRSSTIQAICSEYVNKRRQYKKRKLRWRLYKKSLGWIPFKKDGISIKNDTATYFKNKFKFWKSREHGKIKCGSFCQDSKGGWYINLTCDIPIEIRTKTNKEIGIDLGLKTIATCSDGLIINRENITKKYEQKLSMAQRANKNKLVTSIHEKIKNTRKDFNNKETTKLIKRYDRIFVGNVSSSKLVKTNMAKSVSDASWAAFKSSLEYKAIRFGVDFKIVNESFSTVTCSNCLNKTKQLSGLSTLEVREWICEHCGTLHNRDINAAINILRTGHCTPKGIPIKKEDVKVTIELQSNTEQLIKSLIK